VVDLKARFKGLLAVAEAVQNAINNGWIGDPYYNDDGDPVVGFENMGMRNLEKHFDDEVAKAKEAIVEPQKVCDYRRGACKDSAKFTIHLDNGYDLERCTVHFIIWVDVATIMVGGQRPKPDLAAAMIEKVLAVEFS
jgi:hypothetical protein